MSRRKAAPPAPEGAPLPASVGRTAFDWVQPVPLSDVSRKMVPVRLTANLIHAGEPLAAGMLLAVTPELAAQLVEHFGVGVREGQG